MKVTVLIDGITCELSVDDETANVVGPSKWHGGHSPGSQLDSYLTGITSDGMVITIETKPAA